MSRSIDSFCDECFFKTFSNQFSVLNEATSLFEQQKKKFRKLRTSDLESKYLHPLKDLRYLLRSKMTPK